MNEKLRSIMLGMVFSVFGAVCIIKGISGSEMFAYILGFFSIFAGIYFFFELGSYDYSDNKRT